MRKRCGWIGQADFGCQSISWAEFVMGREGGYTGDSRVFAESDYFLGLNLPILGTAFAYGFMFLGGAKISARDRDQGNAGTQVVFCR